MTLMLILINFITPEMRVNDSQIDSQGHGPLRTKKDYYGQAMSAIEPGRK